MLKSEFLDELADTLDHEYFLAHFGDFDWEDAPESEICTDIILDGVFTINELDNAVKLIKKYNKERSKSWE